MRMAPKTFGVFAVRARARSIGIGALSSVRMCAQCACAHGVYLLVDHCFSCTCTASIVFLLYTVRARTVYSTIVVLLSVRMCTVRNNNPCLNFCGCARNLSPCFKKMFQKRCCCLLLQKIVIWYKKITPKPPPTASVYQPTTTL